MLPEALRPTLTDFETSADGQRMVTGRRSTGIDGAGWTDRQERRGLTHIGIDRGAEPQAVRVISAPFMPDGPGASRRC